jgi:hypothetical protein
MVITPEKLTILDFFEPTASLITAVAAALAAYFAYRGLDSWLKETVGRRKIELSEDVLSDFYQFRDIVSSVRSAFSYPTEESRKRVRNTSDSEQLNAALDSHYVPIARIDEHREFLSTFFAKKYRVMSYFGSKAAVPFEEANSILSSIRAAAIGLMNSARRQRPPNANIQDLWESTIWEGHFEEGGEDLVKSRVDKAVSDIENICGPFLKGQHS